MEDHGDDTNSPNQSSERSEPVRSRWTPKPEQILILESIFNSGMVNPPKDETVRIRKLLEKFGSVGDANVFYWFQNRRSRSRRRQRQMQAAATLEQTNHSQAGGAIHYEGGGGGAAASAAAALNFGASPSFASSPSSYLTGGGSSSSCGVSGDGGGGGATIFPVSGQMGFAEIEHSAAVMPVTPSFCPSDNSNIHFQSGYILVFINGVPTEVPKGALDMKAMFGNDAVLVHSSGVPVLTNEFGFSVQSLQHGENYFLVSKTNMS